MTKWIATGLGDMWSILGKGMPKKLEPKTN
jgi:hypothetical protein